MPRQWRSSRPQSSKPRANTCSEDLTHEKLLPIWASLFWVALLTGCQIPSHSKAPRFDPRPNAAASAEMNATTVRRTLDPALLQPPRDLFTLGPGDRIEVEILGTANSRTILTVGPDGKIYYDLLPGLDVWGLTLEQTKKLLQQELGKLHVHA